MTKISLFKLLLLALLVITISTISYGQKLRLRSQVAPNCTSSAGASLRYSDIFGEGNTAVIGSYGCRGAFIYDITNPDAPILASWYNPGNNQQFLEAIIVNGRGYFGSGNGGGVHVVDLTNPYSPQLLGIVNSANGNGHNSIHEMVVFQQGGATYLIENFNGFTSKILKFINVTNPAAAAFVRDLNPTEPQWVHAMVVKGNRMFTSGWGNSTNRGRTEIYDVANISTTAPALLGFIDDQTSVTAGNSMHSAWPSEDGNWLYSARETSTGSGDLRVYNISNPAAPLLVNKLTMIGLGLNAVTPHNPVVSGNYLYVAWYQAGVQVFDLTNPGTPVRVAQFDTYQSQFVHQEQEKQALLDAEPWDLVCASDFRQNALPTTYDGNWAVFPFLGTNRVLAGDLASGLYVLDASQIAAPLKNKVSDFDGDGRTDLSVFRSSNGNWEIEQSSNGSTSAINFGLSGDVITPGDYDGDGIIDLAIFRPSTGVWWMRRSSSPGSFFAVQFGANGDVPVAADYDADGKTDIAVWRPSNGGWYILQSTLGIKIVQWGLSTDKPITGDFEGDGKSDVAVWRPSNGVWYVLQSSSSIPMFAYWGTNGDKPLTGDFTGDGRSDYAVYRPSNGAWFILDPTTGNVSGYNWGLAEDMPIPADYDGDAKADLTVFRPSTREWHRLNSSNGAYILRVYGQTGDKPSPSSVQPQ